MIEKIHSRWAQFAAIVVGGFIYAFGMNEFLLTYGLYSGGGVGVAQIITFIIQKLSSSTNANIYGAVYMAINIPILLIAWRSLGRDFFIKTLIGAASISFFSTILPIPAEPLVAERITAAMVGGIITGIGTGVILVAGGSGGGLDVIAVWAAKKFRGASVGSISLYVNAVIYALLLLLFDIQTVLYSLIYMVFFTFMMDRVHYQNISVRLMIFTKKDGIDRLILEKTGRGVTEWQGIGAYTREDTKILISCINKFELSEFTDIIHSIDPNAFIIADEGVHVVGNFEKRL